MKVKRVNPIFSHIKRKSIKVQSKESIKKSNKIRIKQMLLEQLELLFYSLFWKKMEDEILSKFFKNLIYQLTLLSLQLETSEINSL